MCLDVGSGCWGLINCGRWVLEGGGELVLWVLVVEDEWGRGCSDSV